VCRSKHVEPSINFGIINSITKLHLVGISTESYYDARIHEYQISRVFLSISIAKRKIQRALNVATDKFIITEIDMHAAMQMFQFVSMTDRHTRVPLGQMINIYVSINRE